MSDRHHPDADGVAGRRHRWGRDVPSVVLSWSSRASCWSGLVHGLLLHRVVGGGNVTTGEVVTLLHRHVVTQAPTMPSPRPDTASGGGRQPLVDGWDGGGRSDVGHGDDDGVGRLDVRRARRSARPVRRGWTIAFVTSSLVTSSRSSTTIDGTPWSARKATTACRADATSIGRAPDVEVEAESGHGAARSAAPNRDDPGRCASWGGGLPPAAPDQTVGRGSARHTAWYTVTMHAMVPAAAALMALPRTHRRVAAAPPDGRAAPGRVQAVR